MPTREGRRYTPQEMIGELIRFDTTSRNSNMALILFVEDYLASWGVTSQLVFNADRSKANLYATLGDDARVDRAPYLDLAPCEQCKRSECQGHERGREPSQAVPVEISRGNHQSSAPLIGGARCSPMPGRVLPVGRTQGAPTSTAIGSPPYSSPSCR